ncbi:hypothetical protein [Arthrobacter sp. NA-172]|uniref:hypothetical protein n=1 Tax=Arthrobacter sp. NA-172 TaxID=3367524 RepID=UPI003754F856
MSKTASYAGALILLTLLSFWRIPQVAQGVVWAEDGAVFLTDALNHPQVLTLVHPYSGYLHVVPRLAADVVVRFFALRDYGLALNVLACAAVAVVSLMTYHCSSAVTGSKWIRAAWAAIPIFVNVGAIETLGNFANMHWYLLWLAPWLLLKPAKSKFEGSLLFVVAALSSLTEIITILFVPLFLYRLRDKNLWAARAGLALGLACQIYATLTHPRGGSASYHLDPLSALYGWFLNTSGPIVYGTSTRVMQQIISFGPAPMILAALLVVAVFVAVLILGSKRDKWLAGLFLTASVVIWCGCVFSNPAHYLDYASFSASDWKTIFLFGRYSVVPTMFVLALLPLFASAMSRFGKSAPAAVLVAFSLLLASMYFPPSTSRDNGPVWAEQVLIGRNLCGQAADTNFYDVPTAPAFFEGKVRISCPALKAG